MVFAAKVRMHTKCIRKISVGERWRFDLFMPSRRIVKRGWCIFLAE